MDEVPEYLQSFAIRLMDEGVPLIPIARAFGVSSADLRPVVEDALVCGRLLDRPRDDWFPGHKRSEREPSTPKTPALPDDSELLLGLKRVFFVTKLQATVLIPLLRRGQCTREMIHAAIEDNRGNPQTATNPKIIDVVLCHLRKRLKPFGIGIRTLHAIGYAMTQSDRQAVLDLAGLKG